MARETTSYIGSGTIPATRGILSSVQRGTNDDAIGAWGGTNVTLINVEDLTSVDIFAVSGVEVTQNPKEILNPYNNLLPRTRNVKIQNTGPENAYIGNTSGVLWAPLDDVGYVIMASGTEQSTVDIPILHNNSIWAKTRDATTYLRMLIT